MKFRLAGKIICGSFCVIFVILALIYGSNLRAEEHILRGILFAVLSLTSATGYRYFEY